MTLDGRESRVETTSRPLRRRSGPLVRRIALVLAAPALAATFIGATGLPASATDDGDPRPPVRATVEGLPQSAAYRRTLWGSGTRTLKGGSAPVRLWGSGMGQTLVAGSGDTTFGISNTADRVVGGPGVDTVIAYDDFTLPDGVENLTLNGQWGLPVGIGNAAANILTADKAGEVLIGEGGDDVLIGPGRGVTFVFGPGSGKDIVDNFVGGPGGDVAQLSGYGFTRFDQVRSALVQVGPDAVLRLSPTDQITFHGVQAKTLTADNFHLQLDTSRMRLAFNEDFTALSLYDPETGTGIWKTNYSWDDQNGLGSHTILRTDGEIYVDPRFKGLGNASLRINPFSIKNGVLGITVSQTPAADQPALWGYRYTSGLLTTQKSYSQLYGYFEIRAQLPVGKGLWPAFWLLPADGSTPGELDVFEGIGDKADTVHTTAIDWATHEIVGVRAHVQDLAGAFHTFGVLWTAATVTFYIDGVETSRTATPASMHQPAYMLVNLAVGKEGSWVGAPDRSTPLPATLRIDYIRAYTVDDWPGVTPSP